MKRDYGIYCYPATEINPALKIEIMLFEDRGSLYFYSDREYHGDQEGLLEAIRDYVDACGYSSKERDPKHLDGQCLLCDYPVVPTPFHDAQCEYCGVDKVEVMDGLGEQQRLVQGQSCVDGHYVCSDCYTERRPEAQYIPD